MENHACVEGFGMTLSARESKFSEPREFFQKNGKVVKTVNKSRNLKKKFQDLYAQRTGSSKVAMLWNSPQQPSLEFYQCYFDRPDQVQHSSTRSS
jgi:hypothetical protein